MASFFMQININYNVTNLEDFKAAIEYAKAEGVAVRLSSPQPAGARDSEAVAKWKALTGSKKFRLNAEEKARVDAGDCTPDDIARERSAALTGVDAGEVEEIDGVETDVLVPENAEDTDEDSLF
jgi:hypothetical protein